VVSEHSASAVSPRRATIVGLLVACSALAVWAVWLVTGEGSAPKALVAVWLAALPVLGIGALAGWLIGDVVLVIGRRLPSGGGRNGAEGTAESGSAARTGRSGRGPDRR
jgi:hypothetical protein